MGCRNHNTNLPRSLRRRAQSRPGAFARDYVVVQGKFLAGIAGGLVKAASEPVPQVGNRARRHHASPPLWIPAFAGMTSAGAGMSSWGRNDEVGAVMTNGGRVDKCGSVGMRALWAPVKIIFLPMTSLFCRRQVLVQEFRDDWLVYRTAGIVHAIGVFVQALFV